MFFLVTYHWKVDKVEPFLNEIHELSPTKIGIFHEHKCFLSTSRAWASLHSLHRVRSSRKPSESLGMGDFSEHWKQSHYRTGK